MMCIFILSPIVVFFLLNTSNYSCFVAACGLLFFHIGVVCLIFTSLLLYYVIILLYFFLYFYLCRQDGTNFRWKKWIIHCIYSPLSLCFVPPLPYLPALSLKTTGNSVT